MKGRKPYPFQVIKSTNASKNHLTKEQLNNRAENEPQIRSSILKCPRHLSREAKREWKRIVTLYQELSEPIMNDLDTNDLEIYCEAMVTYRKAMAKVRETSEIYTSKTDPNKPRKNPWLTIANEASAQVKKYGEGLLMNPVSRARVCLAKANTENLSPMELYFKRKQEGSNDP